MRKVYSLLLIALFAVTLSACGNTQQNETGPSDEAKNDTQTFKIGAIPDQDVSNLNRRFNDFATYLSEQTGLNVEYVPSQDYAALVTAFNRGEIQLGWFGGLTGVQARSQVEGAEAIAQRPSDQEFHSVFIKQAGLDVESLKDLEGKSFTFGSESSTSGHLMPRHFLTEAGINPEEDFAGEPNYSGSHDATYQLVEAGSFETGALNELVWKSAVEEGKVDTDKVDVFYTTPAYYDYNWTINNVNDTFGEGTKQKVQDALLNMGEKQKDILELFHTDQFIKTKNENYKAIEDVAKSLGIIK
ncbi:putative selenate ABC transporter substrate-binding protein [Virgibacillus sp. MSP4-1]|uniref:putative selenate ABC transporter substrate-binding protein n=1 Tax=Virgibacillus sp. MSP4-1 TaxID=2700081 RepID=UPI0003A43046|nr:putative selenate ABC transporter substrate-binding protein [Virgibacillus sp. MSP4-1]QHS21474.1 putative selenate ABC transporter substrate-binding protein [Virgibacillus sp. MSP4-1]